MDVHEAYALDDLSDEDGGASSSDDEAEVFEKFLQKAIQRSRKAQMCKFEEEMERERLNRFTAHQKDSGFQVTNVDKAAEPSTTGAARAEYDKVYFDSDDDEPYTDKQKRERKFMTNDELLYDPELDDKDQKWVEKQRRKYLPGNKSMTQTTVKPLPNSDAILNCPACFHTLCMDCQRHEVYRTQYRAMFVCNCRVDTSHVLRYPHLQNGKKNKKKEAKLVTETAEAQEEAYYSVKCAECSTEVGVVDQEEVYHFFNVVASH